MLSGQGFRTSLVQQTRRSILVAAHNWGAEEGNLRPRLARQRPTCQGDFQLLQSNCLDLHTSNGRLVFCAPLLLSETARQALVWHGSAVEDLLGECDRGGGMARSNSAAAAQDETSCSARASSTSSSKHCALCMCLRTLLRTVNVCITAAQFMRQSSACMAGRRVEPSRQESYPLPHRSLTSARAPEQARRDANLWADSLDERFYPPMHDKPLRIIGNIKVGDWPVQNSWRLASIKPSAACTCPVYKQVSQGPSAAKRRMKKKINICRFPRTTVRS